MTKRYGMSLLELMLVLAIIVAIGAVALPVLKGPLENQRLRKAADQVRTEWNRTRVRAMKSGRIQVFRGQVGSGQYSVQTWYADNDDATSANDSMAFGNSSTSTGMNAFQETRELPEGIIITGGDASSDSRSTDVEQQFGTAEVQALRPILFYPDGTSSTAKLILSNESQGYYIVVSMRGLTGIAQASDLLTAQELSQ